MTACTDRGDIGIGAQRSAMQGFSGTLWPIRYKPLDDELLSCWLVRLAHGHGLKVQTFCNLLFGKRLQIWNRDIDRLAPAWLLDELIARTGTSRAQAEGTSLRVFEGVLYPQFKESGNLLWILAAQVYHRRRMGQAQQFCARCLADDGVPYFRKTAASATNRSWHRWHRHRSRWHRRLAATTVIVADATDRVTAAASMAAF